MEDLISKAREMAEVWNDHDIEGALSFFADDAVVQLDPLPPEGEYVGKESVRLWLEQIFSENFHVDNSRNYRQSGNTVSWSADLHLDRFSRMGFDLVYPTVEVTFKDGLIKLMISRLDDASIVAMRNAMASGQMQT